MINIRSKYLKVRVDVLYLGIMTYEDDLQKHRICCTSALALTQKSRNTLFPLLFYALVKKDKQCARFLQTQRL